MATNISKREKKLVGIHAIDVLLNLKCISLCDVNVCNIASHLVLLIYSQLY